MARARDSLRVAGAGSARFGTATSPKGAFGPASRQMGHFFCWRCWTRSESSKGGVVGPDVRRRRDAAWPRKKKGPGRLSGLFFLSGLGLSRIGRRMAGAGAGSNNISAYQSFKNQMEMAPALVGATGGESWAGPISALP